MARLILVDGKVVEVDYNKAATIYQILQGNKELDKDDPDFAKKEEFLLKVKEVKFDDGHSAKSDRPWEKWANNGRDGKSE